MLVSSMEKKQEAVGVLGGCDFIDWLIEVVILNEVVRDNSLPEEVIFEGSYEEA